MQFTLKDLSIDTESRTVLRQDNALKLSDLSFDVFVALIEAAPAPVSVEQFSQSVWKSTYVNQDTIAQRITLLRKNLGDDPKSPKYIRTVRGNGYAVSGKVIRQEGSLKPRSSSALISRPRTIIAIIAGGLLLVATGTLIVKTFSSHGGHLAPAMTESDAGSDTDDARLVGRAQQQLSLHQAQETDRAIEMLRDVLDREPERYDARLTLSFALSTKATKFRGDKEDKLEAEAIARTLIRQRPESSNAWSALGYTLSSQGRADEALAAYRQSYNIDPQNASALSSAAHLLLVKGDLQQALVLEVRAKAAGGDSRYAEIQIAQLLELIGHPAADKWRAQALALNPGQAVILKEVATSLMRRGQPQAALDVLEHYEGNDESAPQILVLRGRALIALDRAEEARRVLESAGWRGYYGLAAMSAAAGDPAVAEKFFPPEKRNLLETDPDPDLYIQLAEISAALGRQDEALRLTSQAINLGWRDIAWLQQSPFLGTLMSSPKGLEIETRIAQELDAQRRLIESTEALRPILRD